MNTTFSIYETETGKVKRIVTANTDGAAQCDDGESYLEGEHQGYIGVTTPLESVVLKVRMQRDILLATTDYTHLADSPLSHEKKLEWALYRQALRDLPSQYQDETDIDNVVYPTPPEA